MRLCDVVENCSVVVLFILRCGGRVLFDGPLIEFVLSRRYKELRNCHVTFIATEGPYLSVVIRKPIETKPIIRDLLFGILMVLLGLLFGWSMQGVWF